MATIGLDSLFYAPITIGANDEETYGTPARLAKAMQADITINRNEATLYADDGTAEKVDEFKDGTISLGIDDIGAETAVALLGVTVDSNGVIVSTTEDNGGYHAVGFRAMKANGKYRYFWLYKVKFAVPSQNMQTKGDSISFSTPTIEGTILRRNRADSRGKHPWKTEVTEGETGVAQSVITNWFNNVYEPSYSAADATLSSLTIGNLTLTPAFSSAVTTYTAATTNATNTVTAVANAAGASVEITVNGTEISSGSSVTWEEGENTVEVEVTNGSVSRTYTVTVTKS